MSTPAPFLTLTTRARADPELPFAGKLPIVRHEIEDIQALLEEEPDSRCKPTTCSPAPRRWRGADRRCGCLLSGCLDSLVYYQRLLVTLLGAEDDTRAEREALNLDSLEKLRRLEKVDPTRGARYRDLGKPSAERVGRVGRVS